MSTPPTADDRPATLAEFASRLAVAAGDAAAAMRADGVAIADTKSSAVDVVTEADRAAERLLVEMIRAERPEDSVLGEEGGASVHGSSPITWVLDPIDGTVNYLYGLPIFSVSVAATVADPAAADGRRAIAGCVYAPVTGEIFLAHAGGGATRNGEPIAVRQEQDLAQALVGTGFGYTASRRAEQAGIVSAVLPRVRDLRRFGSAAYDLCLLASGRLDLFYERGLQPWDYAAGLLIAAEAGADVLGHLDGTAPGEHLLVAGNPGLAAQLRPLVSH